MISIQFAKFLLAGGLAALVNFLSRILFSHWMAYVPAIIIAYCVGMLTAFILNRLFVFQPEINRLHKQAAWFIAVNIAALLQTLIISVVLAYYLLPHLNIHHNADTIAHGVGVIVPVISSYIGHKYLTFR